VKWEDCRLDLSTKVALVTGGARGIGRATCMALAREGIKAVAIVDQMEDLDQVAALVNDHVQRQVLIPFRGDVTDAAFRRSVFAGMRERFGVVSICVPAAAITRDQLAAKVDDHTGKAATYPEDDFNRVMEVDLKAPIYWAIETIAGVAEDRHARRLGRWHPGEGVQGCIVFIGSVSAAGNRGQISYATAKAGLEGAQATLSIEAIFHGVRCGIIHPGYTDTAMVRVLGEDFIREKILPQTQLKRLVLPEEVAHAICFMIRNSAVSGELWADAGWRPMP
jgi:NAD(P)-dependent dehydrogenase (short-subunit alcohol dehydrogenase family)